jgi:NAD-dependent protein deacetylase/lipoamidase
MIASDLDGALARLQKLVHAAGTILPFTGAGISTECGIPDFRSPGGLWTKNRPIPFDEFISSQEARNESWRRRFAMEEHFARARPGRGHRAIASLYRAGKVPAVVTQNIDNLHQASGIPAEDIINRDPTDFDEVADLVVREDIGTVLEPFVAAQSAV